MRKCTCPKRLLVWTGAMFCLTVSAALAADTTATPQVVVSEAPAVAPSVAPVPAPSDAAPARLPYGVEDVLKLSRAQISEEIIQNYVQSSGTVYNLSPNDIVYLRNQGVSDRVVTAMLDQRKRASESVAQSAPPPAAAPVPSYGSTAAAAPTYNYAAAPADAQPQPNYVQPAAPSSVYVIPYPQATSAYYSYPYYGSSYYGPYWGGYYGPSLSLGFAFGGGWGHGGGFHSGFHSGGGFHGGSHGGFHGHH